MHYYKSNIPQEIRKDIIQVTRQHNEKSKAKLGIEAILLKYRDEILKPPFRLSAHIMEGRLNILQTYPKSEEIISFYSEFSCILIQTGIYIFVFTGT